MDIFRFILDNYQTVAFTVVALLYVRYLWSRRWLYYHTSKVNGPFSFPLLGNVFEFGGGPDVVLDRLMRICSKYGTPTRLWMANRPIYLISKPEDLEIVLNKVLHKKTFYRFMQQVLPKGILATDYNLWKQQRRIILPTFNQKILNSFMEINTKQANILCEQLRKLTDGRFFDAFVQITHCTVDIICESALGTKTHAQTEGIDCAKWIQRIVEILIKRISRPWLHNDFIWKLHPWSQEINRLSTFFKNFVQNIIEWKRREKLNNKDTFEDNTGKYKAFLDSFLDFSEDDKLTDDEIIDQTGTIIVGGSETTSSTISFTLIMLGMHPEIQERVYQEVSDVFGNIERELTPDDISKMAYLERVIKETLRIFSVPYIAREAQEDVQLSNNVIIPKNSVIGLILIDTHRNPQLWPDPLKFDPDRFLPEQVAKRHPYSYIPFSAGPRNCIGMKYAMMEMKVLLAYLVKSFKVTTVFKSIEEIKLKGVLISKPVDGCQIALENR